MSQSEVRSKPRVPPGQIVTKGWPVLHAGGIPDLSKDSWDLRIHGLVENPFTISYNELLKMKITQQACDIHCVTSWSRLGMQWEGVKFRDLMELAKPKENARNVVFECEHGFTTNLPLEVVMDDDVLVAFRADGQDLPVEHGGPVRMLVPKRYFYKSAKWLRGIRLVQDDEPGFWEIRGYSNTADPWNEERYAGISYAEIVKNRLKAYARRKND